MTRKRILCAPLVKCDEFWIADWYDLTGVTPDAKKIAKAVKEFRKNGKRFVCKRGKPRTERSEPH